jgi:hypothetical protein
VRIALFAWFLSWTAAAFGSVERIPIASGLELKPGETHRVAIDATTRSDRRRLAVAASHLADAVRAKPTEGRGCWGCPG